MNRIVIPTGYMGSGSSALTDFIAEHRGYEHNNGSFEYVFLHCPNGLFDLEDKLLVGNNALRSDEAIRSFHKAMSDLYELKTWWPANYRKNLSPNFMRLVDAFIDRIVDYRTDAHWYPQEKLPLHRVPRRFFATQISRLTKGALSPKVPLLYEGMTISLISPSDFHAAARDFLNAVFIELGIKQHNLLLDQLLLPFNAWRMSNYFDSNAICFIVARDPRDVYLLNKYVWGPQKDSIPFPTDVEEFCCFYKKMRMSEKSWTESTNVRRLFFEDLLYNYDETGNLIRESLGLDDGDHIHREQHFNPNRSIMNTQLFNIEAFKAEADRIQELLPEYLYDFPYSLTPDTSVSF